MTSKINHSSSELNTFNIEPVYNLIFQNIDGEIGRLEFDSDELVFKGDVEESSKYFVDFLCESFNQKIDELVDKKIKERLNE